MPKGSPLQFNAEFHKWFYSTLTRQKYDEKSDLYKSMQLAWEEGAHRAHNVPPSPFYLRGEE